MKNKLLKLVTELNALVPPDVIKKKTGGFLWPPRPEMPGQEVPDYAAQLKQNVANSEKSAQIQARARTTWLREGVLDYVKATQDPAIWDLETSKLRPQVKDELLGRLDKGLAALSFDPSWVKGVAIIGSIVGRQWRSDSDVDIEIMVDEGVPDEVVQGAIDSFVDSVNGMPLQGTVHPVNFFFTKSSPPIETLEGAYSLVDDTWTKKPSEPPENFDPETEYAESFKAGREIADEIVELFAELRRDVSDMQELKNVDSEFADDLQLKKLQAVNETVLCLTRISKVLWRVRDDAFKAGGDPQHSPENLLYKFVEKSGELKLLHKLSDVRGRYIDDLAKVLGAGGENA